MPVRISVVVPTYNRRESLLRLLKSLDQSTCPLHEVIIVDSGDERISDQECRSFSNLKIYHIVTEKSVCIQRNAGIKMATGSWIFLCDDDLEVPQDYLENLVDHIEAYPNAGAVSGIVLQKKGNDWVGQYKIISFFDLCARFIFQLSIWGTIENVSNNFLTRCIKNYYERKGNHLSKAGWPVITDFSGEYFKTPVYGLGASLVKKEWLINSPYDEVLDVHGIGDNYGVAVGFPKEGIHVVNKSFVYHHQASENRLSTSVQYFRRVLALHYFIKANSLRISFIWFLWSLLGNMLMFIFSSQYKMSWAPLKAMCIIVMGRNPYLQGKQSGNKTVSPEL